MDWNLSELKQEDIFPSIDAFDRSNINGDFSIDLKLGRVGSLNAPDSDNQWKKPAISKMESSSSSSSSSASVKRARGSNNGNRATFCLVDGCNADLSNCRDYHRRHKVCAVHSKTPQVTIKGLKQRFCQQCSRFHSLEEFDMGKRSCRKRLDGHNRRRRKPQPDSLSPCGSFWSNFKANQFLAFSTSSTAIESPTWAGGVVNAETDANATTHTHHALLQQMHMPTIQNLFCGSSLCRNYKETNVGGMATTYSMFCDNLTATTAAQVEESDCALSLLSSMQTQTSGNNMLQSNSIPLVRPIDVMDSVVDNTHAPTHHSLWSSANKSPLALPPFSWE